MLMVLLLLLPLFVAAVGSMESMQVVETGLQLRAGAHEPQHSTSRRLTNSNYVEYTNWCCADRNELYTGTDHTLASCAAKCEEFANCVSFEYFRNYADTPMIYGAIADNIGRCHVSSTCDEASYHYGSWCLGTDLYVASVCQPGTDAGFLLNDICAPCPDDAMVAAGFSNCHYIGYVQHFSGAPSTYTYTVPLGVAEIQVDAFGARGGDTSGTSATLGGEGGYISAVLPVTAGQALTVVMGPAPDIRTLAEDITSTASLNSRLVVAGEGGWGTYHFHAPSSSLSSPSSSP